MMRNDMKEKLWEKGKVQRYLSLFLVAVLVTTQCTQSWSAALVRTQTTCAVHEEYDESCDECNLQGELKLTENESEEGTTEPIEGETESTESEEETDEPIEGETEETESTESEEETDEPIEEETEETESTESEEEITEPIEGETEETESTESEEETAESIEGETEETESTESEEETAESIEDETEETESIENEEAAEESVELETEETELQQIEETVETEAMLQAFEKGSVEINATTFPDLSFRNLVKERFDDGDNVLTVTELGQIKIIDLCGQYYEYSNGAIPKHDCNRTVTSLKGIEYFTSLEELYCGGAGIAELDVSMFPQLNTLVCNNNHLTKLDVSNNTELYRLYCESNQLTTLDVGGMESLKYLYCQDNDLTSLNVRGCTKLSHFRCQNNELSSLDVSETPALYDFYADHNNLTSINLSNNSSLQYAWLNNNQLTSIEFGEITKVTGLGVHNNQLTSLDVSHLTALNEFYCGNNQLTSLDLSNCKSTWTYAWAYCENNKLTSLTLGESSFTILSCTGNELTELDASGCTRLSEFYCGGNNLTSLNLGECTAKTIVCANNRLEELDLSGCGQLKNLYCQGNKLTELNISGLSLTTLTASDQALGKLSMYEETDGTWLNKEEQESDLARKFAQKTTFHSASPMTEENKLAFEVNTSQELTADTIVPVVRPVYFKNVLAEGLEITGSFTYTAVANDSELDAASGIISVSAAKELDTAADLITGKYITITGTEVYDSVQCVDFSKIKEGTPGKYEVTIQSGNYFCETTIEVAREISDETYFADETLQNILSEHCDSGEKDGLLTIEELNAVTMIDLCGLKYTDESTAVDHLCNVTYTSLKGIEYFTNLEELYCGGTGLTELNVSMFPKLTILQCSNNVLTNLDVGSNPQLYRLYCKSNQLTTLDVGGMESLTFLYCQDNDLMSLNVRGCTKLSRFRCQNNELSSLDVSETPALYDFYADHNNLTSIDLSNNSSLQYAWLNHNQLTSIEFGEITKITGLGVQHNQLTSLDVSHFTALNEFYCDNNQLTSLDLSNCKSTWTYAWAYCGNNKLTSLTLGESSFTILSCAGNELTELDASGCTRLSELYCGDNNLTSLNLGECTAKTIGCSNNQLEELDLSGCGQLKKLYCQGNKLTELNISGLSLTTLTASDQALGKLSMYEETDGTWLNKEEQESDLARKFAQKTTFHSASPMTEENKLAFEVNTSQELTADTIVPVVRPVYFKNVLAEGLEITGSFTYTAVANDSELDAASGVISVSAAKELDAPSDLITGKYITITGSEVYDAVQCINFDKVQEGIPGQYDVIIQLGKYFCETTIEVAREISDETYFADGTLQNILSEHCDSGEKDGLLTIEELNAVTMIDLCGLKYTDESTSNTHLCNLVCTSLKGIEYFTNLEELYCGGVGLTKLNVSMFPKLTILQCSDNSLTNLEVSSNSELHRLFCMNNQLGSLDVGGLSGLEYLYCYNNDLMSLNVHGCIKLHTLKCEKNELTSLNLSEMPDLYNFWGDGNNFTSLNFSNNPKICYAWINSNQLTSIEFGNITSILGLGVNYNQLTSLDVSRFTDLAELYCGGNQLTSLDLSNCKTTHSFFWVQCWNNKLTNLNLGECTVTDLNCEGNALTELDISECPRLKILNASNQRLGNLSMYEEADGTWLNKEVQETDLARKFTSDTTFHSASAMTEDNKLAFEVNDDNTLTADSLVPVVKPVYFQNLLADGKKTLTGSFTYTATSELSNLTATAGVIDLNDAKRLESANELVSLNYISVTGLVDGAYNVQCADFENSINEGILGQYEVIVTSGKYFCETTIEVAVKISSSENFIDEDFQNYLSANCDEGEIEDFLTTEELSEVTQIDLNETSADSRVYNDLTGIHYFANLETLDCSGGSITDLDVSQNTMLQTLNCNDNQLNTLTLGTNSNLTTLECSVNNLTALELGGCENLETLKCTDNELENLLLSGNPDLKTLYCSYNPLGELDLTNNSLLTDLSCNSNQLKELEIGNLTQLQNLSCTENELAYLDLTGLAELENVDASGQSITNLLMTYSSSDGNGQWRNKAVQETDTVRRFHTCITEFIDSDTKEALEFYVESDGTLVATTILPMSEEVTFKGDLNDSAEHTWTLSGTFTYVPQASLTSANTLLFTVADLQQQLQTLKISKVTDLNKLTGLLTVTPAIGEVQNEVVIDMDAGDFAKLCNGTGGTYDYKATLTLAGNKKEMTGQIIVYADVVSMIEIPATIELKRDYQEDNAIAEASVNLRNELETLFTGEMKIYADSDITLKADGVSDQLSVNVYKENNGVYEEYDKETALAILSAQVMSGKFKLISSDVTQLKPQSYTGTMQFRIEYEE